MFIIACLLESVLVETVSGNSLPE